MWTGLLSVASHPLVPASLCAKRSTAMSGTELKQSLVTRLTQSIRTRLTKSGSLPARPATKSVTALDLEAQYRGCNNDDVVDAAWERYRRTMHDYLGWSFGFSKSPSQKKIDRAKEDANGLDSKDTDTRLRMKANQLRVSWTRREQRRALGKSCATAASVLAASK